MISCKGVASPLMSDRLESQSLWKRMKVRLHLAMCRFCSRLARHIALLRSGARLMSDGDDPGEAFEELKRHLSGR